MDIQKVGVIAGRGDLPHLLKQKFIAHKMPHFFLGIKSVVNENICDIVLPIGQLGKAIRTFQKEKVSHVIFIGGLDRPARDQIKPDLKGWIFLLTHAFKIKGDNSLLLSLATIFEKAGMTVIGIDDVIPELLVEEKCYTKSKPSVKEKKTILYGFGLAQTLGQMDVGQSVVVQGSLCLGLEAIEGTDNLIQRCEKLKRGKEKPILVKVKKPTQDRRLDLPTIGLSTIKNIVKAGYRGVAVDAGHVLFSEKDKAIAYANEHRVFIIGVKR
ncbi:MAG: UDP-2,3-diacylglucosamine diphosphatase LpxI [Alphaproteobacteria bacterium]|nr:UDP-2,3-diacylglucosamine diphosphatase LpxI [Alphaproteobacteria bacterium]